MYSVAKHIFFNGYLDCMSLPLMKSYLVYSLIKAFNFQIINLTFYRKHKTPMTNIINITVILIYILTVIC